MDNTIKALANLYVALGGDEGVITESDKIPEAINKIAELIASREDT